MKYLALIFLFLSSAALGQSIEVGGAPYPLTKGGSISFAWHPAAPKNLIGQPITTDTVHGNLFGSFQTGATMLSGRTYYMDNDIIIPAGDTLLLQPGVTIIVLGTATNFPDFQMSGTLISMGTKLQPNYVTVLQAKRTYANLQAGLWGGIQCDLKSGDLILHWTHLEYGGGLGNAVGTSKKTAYVIYFQNPSSNFIMEDSWITGGTDDPVRIAGGKISVMRNVWEATSTTSGDACNMKSGTIGDVAYNLFIGSATNGPKLANTGGINPQTNVNIYNNTIVTCGWRITLSGRAGSTDIETGARGSEYNNLIVNCRTGFRLLGGSVIADTANTFYDYQWYFGAVDSIVKYFYPSDGIQAPKPHDKAGAVKANDPMFVAYNVNGIDPSKYIFPISFGQQDPIENVKNSIRFSDLSNNFNSDFHLKPNSPCIGTAFTGPAPVTIPMNAVTSMVSASNPFGATPVGLGRDFGAYQSDGSGNQQ